MDTQIDRRFKRAWDFFTANAGQLVIAALVVCFAWALVIFGPWASLNLLRECQSALRTGRPVRWQATFETTSTFLPAWGLFLLTAPAILLATAMCVVPGVLLAIAWFHAPSYVADGRPVLQSLGDSYRKLTKSDDWVATLLNGLILFGCAFATSFTALLTVVTLPLAMSYLALCSIESTGTDPAAPTLGEPVDVPA